MSSGKHSNFAFNPKDAMETIAFNLNLAGCKFIEEHYYQDAIETLSLAVNTIMLLDGESSSVDSPSNANLTEKLQQQPWDHITRIRNKLQELNDTKKNRKGNGREKCTSYEIPSSIISVPFSKLPPRTTPRLPLDHHHQQQGQSQSIERSFISSATILFNLALAMHLQAACLGMTTLRLKNSLHIYEKAYHLLKKQQTQNRLLLSTSTTVQPSTRPRQDSISIEDLQKYNDHCDKIEEHDRNLFIAILNNVGHIHYDQAHYNHSDACFQQIAAFLKRDSKERKTSTTGSRNNWSANQRSQVYLNISTFTNCSKRAPAA